MLLTERLRHFAAPVWESQLHHPFVTGVGDGSLPADIFRFYLKQDYLYLIDYARLFSFCAARAPNLTTMIRFSSLFAETVGVEMDQHRSFATEFGIAPDQLEAETRAPTNQGYTDFLLATGAGGDYPSMLAALLPCAWGYREVGEHLAKGGPSPDPRYQRWIEMYSGPAYGEFVDWCLALMNEAGEGLPERLIQHLEQVFLTSSRYELAFWEMAWTQESWLR